MIKIGSEFDIEAAIGQNISFVNLYSYLLLRSKVKDYDIDLWFSDGVAICFLERLFLNDVKRVSFDSTSIAPLVFKYASANSMSVAFVGSDEISLSEFCKEVMSRYSLKVVYSRNGYFDNSTRHEALLEIVNLNPDFVICGMGSGMQEEFLSSLRKMGWHGTGFTCGGYFHQTATSGMNYYPWIVDKMNLRFLYRFFRERHTRKRYMVDYPIGAFYFLKDKLKRLK